MDVMIEKRFNLCDCGFYQPEVFTVCYIMDTELQKSCGYAGTTCEEGLPYVRSLREFHIILRKLYCTVGLKIFHGGTLHGQFKTSFLYYP